MDCGKLKLFCKDAGISAAVVFAELRKFHQPTITGLVAFR